jgi:hypothetical protein
MNMRNIILTGAAAVVLSLGAASAFAMGGGNLSPEASPYAVIAPQTLAPQGTHEGRAAYESFQSLSAPQPAYETPAATPEDRTYFSRGR